MNAPATRDAILIDAEMLTAVRRLCQMARLVTGGWSYLEGGLIERPTLVEAIGRLSSLECQCGMVEELLKRRQ